MEGVVKRWITSYGFIDAEGVEKDIFVHLSDVKNHIPLKAGQKVRFDIKEEPRGLKAINVEVIEENE